MSFNTFETSFKPQIGRFKFIVPICLVKTHSDYYCFLFKTTTITNLLLLLLLSYFKTPRVVKISDFKSFHYSIYYYK